MLSRRLLRIQQNSGRNTKLTNIVVTRELENVTGVVDFLFAARDTETLSQAELACFIENTQTEAMYRNSSITHPNKVGKFCSDTDLPRKC